MSVSFTYVYPATGCTNGFIPIEFIDTETYLVGSNEILNPGDIVSGRLLSLPIQTQCMTIIGSEVLSAATYEFVSLYQDTDECLGENSIAVLLEACNDSEFVIPFAANQKYKTGDIIHINPFFFVDGGDSGVIFNDSFKIIDTAPYVSGNTFPLPYIIDYMVYENCKNANTWNRIYYGVTDCDYNESVWILSNQQFSSGDTISLKGIGNYDCYFIDYMTSVIQDSKTNILDITSNSLPVTSTKVFNECSQCGLSLSENITNVPFWYEEINGDGTIYFHNSSEVDILGPNDDVDDGWSYIKVQMPVDGSIAFSYAFTSTDETGYPGYDWAFYYVSQDEPIGDLNIDFESNIFAWWDGNTGGTQSFSFNAGDWVSIGVYSDDSCCGPGLLNLLFNITSYGLYDFTSCDGDGGKVLVPSSKAKNLVNITQLSYTQITNQGLDTMPYNNQDDDYIEISLPSGFTINFINQNYTSVFLSTNGYLTFGNGTSSCCFSIPDEIPSEVGYPGVFISTAYGESDITDGMDDYLFDWYSGLTDNGNQFVVRFEGTYLEYGITPEPPPLVFSFVFYKDQPNYFDLVIESNTIFYNYNSTGGVSDGVNSSWLSTFNSGSEKKYRISSDFYVFKANFGDIPKICGQLGVANNSNLGIVYSDLDFGYNQFNRYTTICGENCVTNYTVYLYATDGGPYRIAKDNMKISDIEYTLLNGPYFDISMGGQVSGDIFSIINYYL